MAVLQVKVETEQLERLKAYGKKRGQTMTQLVTAWIKGLGGGVEDEGVDGAEVAVADGCDSAEAVVVPPAMAMAGLGSGESIQLMRRQVELLERLVAIAEKPVIPVEAVWPVVVEDSVEPAVGSTVVIPAPVSEEVVDLLAGQRARQVAELEAWNQRKEEEEAASTASEVEGEPVLPAKKKGNSGFAEKLKEAAAKAKAEAEAGTPMGGQEAASVEEAVTRDDTPQGVEGGCTTEDAVEVEVLAPAGEEPILARADDDLLKRVEELERQEAAMESWLQDIQDGGDPVAPPLATDASAEDWEVAAADCLKARGKEVTVELLDAALKYWGRS